MMAGQGSATHYRAGGKIDKSAQPLRVQALTECRRVARLKQNGWHQPGLHQPGRFAIRLPRPLRIGVVGVALSVAVGLRIGVA